MAFNNCMPEFTNRCNLARVLLHDFELGGGELYTTLSRGSGGMSINSNFKSFKIVLNAIWEVRSHLELFFYKFLDGLLKCLRGSRSVWGKD